MALKNPNYPGGFYEHPIRYPDISADLEGEPCQYTLVGVWVEDEGYYLGTDSGCSCPSPWESHTEDALTGPLTRDQAIEEMQNLARASYREAYAIDQVDQAINELLEKENN